MERKWNARQNASSAASGVDKDGLKSTSTNWLNAIATGPRRFGCYYCYGSLLLFGPAPLKPHSANWRKAVKLATTNEVVA